VNHFALSPSFGSAQDEILFFIIEFKTNPDFESQGLQIIFLLQIFLP